MILTPDPFLRRFEFIRNLRHRSAPGYATALAGVCAATLLRLATTPLLRPVTFSTFYPVVALATLVGGARAGSLALALAALSGNALIKGPPLRPSLDASALASMAVFIVAGATLVVLVSLLNEAVDRISQLAEQTKELLEVQPIGMILVDAHGIINFVNSQLEDEVGYRRQELRGKPVEILLPEGLRMARPDALGGHVEHAGDRRIGLGREIYVRRRDGSSIPVEIGLSPFRRFGFAGTLATLTDISERKALERRDAAAAEERARVARDLHDGTLQFLAGTAMQLEVLARALQPEQLHEGELIRRLQDDLQSEQRELRDMINAARAPPSARTPWSDFKVEIEQLAAVLARRWNAAISLNIEPASQSMPRELVFELLQIVREAVSNAVRHGAANSIMINAAQAEGGFVLTIADNGVGMPVHGVFDHDELNAMALGPHTLRARVAGLGGRLSVESGASGTNLRITAPNGLAGAKS